jgi:RHS repeat-associated protein
MSHPSRLNAVIARAVDGSKFDLEWYHKNYLDHVYAVSDNGGDLTEHYRYTAFGEVTIYNGTGTVQSSTQIDNAIMWNTRRLDAVSGYYLYKYRHYDPALGRWPSRDPIEEDGGINLYAFVGNEPVNKWDELGLQHTRYDGIDLEKTKEAICNLYEWATAPDPACEYEIECTATGKTILDPSSIHWYFDTIEYQYSCVIKSVKSIGGCATCKKVGVLYKFHWSLTKKKSFTYQESAKCP